MHLTVILLSLVLQCCEAYTIAGCDNNNNIFVREDEGRPFTLVCNNIGQHDTVCWGTSSSSIGCCYNNYVCVVTTGYDVQLERTYPGTRSKLTFTGNIREEENKPFSCYQWNVQYTPTATCYLRIFYPGTPDPDLCFVWANTTTWTVNGYCRIPYIYSSTGAYSCTWYQTHNGQTTNDTLPMAFTSFYDNYGRLYYRGECSFAKPLPTVDGRYEYSLWVSPGTQAHHVGNVQIEHPGPPRFADCPYYTIEGTDLRCSCVPSQARPGNPVATVWWPGHSNKTELVVRNVRREYDESVYTCRLTWGPHAPQTVNYTLRAAYPPNLPPVISGYTADRTVPEGADLRLTCTVTGGNPLVASVTFYCGDHADGTNTTELVPTVGQSSVTSVVNFDPFTAQDDGVTCVCTADWTPRPQSYTHRSEVTLTVIRGGSPVVTSLTLNGDPDELTVNESDAVTITCAASGRPKPSIRVVRVDTGQPLEVDTSHTSGQDENVQQYTLTTSARCQDAAIYRCEASNDNGTDEESVKLQVNCAPTVTEELQLLTDGSTVLFITSEKPVAVMGYPPPSPRVTFFGDTNPFHKEAGRGKATRDVLVLCKPSGYIYMNNCTISRDESTTANSGFYKVTFVNTFGEVSVAVYLEASSQKEGSMAGSDKNQSFPVAAVAGGVAASVVAIVVIIVIVLVIRRRCYRTYDRPNRRRDQDENAYTGLRPTGAAANSRTSGDIDTRGEYEEINPGGTQQTSSETEVRGHTSPGEGTELHDYTDAASAPHV